MLVNENIIEDFKKSLTATIKSIGKSETIEVNFVKDVSSIKGEVINLVEPDINSLTKKLRYIRAEADSMALEIRFHQKKVHNKFLSKNKLANEIFNAVEQSRVEAQGSNIFKGIKDNILHKHEMDINNTSIDRNEEKKIIQAFKYVSYSELTNNKLEGKFNAYKKIIEKKLGSKFNDIFLN